VNRELPDTWNHVIEFFKVAFSLITGVQNAIEEVWE